MTFRRTLRKRYETGYQEGLYGVPEEIPSRFNLTDDGQALRDAYRRGHADGTRTRENRQTYHDGK